VTTLLHIQMVLGEHDAANWGAASPKLFLDALMGLSLHLVTLVLMGVA